MAGSWCKLMVVAFPLTFSIVDGIAVGFITYAGSVESFLLIKKQKNFVANVSFLAFFLNRPGRLISNSFHIGKYSFFCEAILAVCKLTINWNWKDGNWKDPGRGIEQSAVMM